MPRLILWTAFAAFVATMLIYRQILIAVIEHAGAPAAIALIGSCYALALLLHRQEDSY